MPKRSDNRPEFASLRHSSPASLNIQRIRKGKGFVYLRGNHEIRNRVVLGRLTSLGIPPAWNDVWICSKPRGHLQAVGRDARKRKQYVYHPDWRVLRDRKKFRHMLLFAGKLPRIRRRVQRDLKRRGLCRETILAAIVRLLETSCIRVGNEEYARNNHSFGLTTFRDRHVRISRGRICFHFRGKSGKEHAMAVSDATLARVVRRCRDVSGQELFQYVDAAGRRRGIDSGDVNDYLREISGGDFTAKDFRTWIATVRMVVALAALPRFHSKAGARRNVNAAIQSVAEQIGNTPAICRKSYVHPAIIESYIDGRNVGRRLLEAGSVRGLKREEAVVLRLLQ